MLAGGREGPGWGSSPGTELASPLPVPEAPLGHLALQKEKGMGRRNSRTLARTPEVREVGGAGERAVDRAATGQQGRVTSGVVLRRTATGRAAHLPGQWHLPRSMVLMSPSWSWGGPTS